MKYIEGSSVKVMLAQVLRIIYELKPLGKVGDTTWCHQHQYYGLCLLFPWRLKLQHRIVKQLRAPQNGHLQLSGKTLTQLWVGG